MIQSRVLFLTEQGLLFIKKKKPLQLCFYYLIWVVTSKQAVNGTIQAAKRASERKERVSEEKGGKTAMKGYTLPLQTQTPYRSKQEKRWMVKDELHQISPKCS